MISAKNSLKVFVSPLLGVTNVLTIDALPEGEIGLFNADTGSLLSSGTGIIALRKNGVVLKSKPVTLATSWAANTKSYSAPVLKTSTITVPTATVGETYQLKVDVRIPGMRGEYFYMGNHVAVTGDTTTTVADGLVATINNQLAKEGKSSFLTISNTGAVISIVAVMQNYIEGKSRGLQTDFVARLTYPEDVALLETVSVQRNDGIGYGPNIAWLEYFAQGDSDPHRLIGWRNNFDFVGNASAIGEYDVIVLNEDNQQKTTSGIRVDAPMEYLIAFNTLGATPKPIIDAAEDGDTAVTGVAYPGSSVILSVDGSPESAVTANATTGIFSVTVTVATDEVLTATAQSGSNPISVVSDSVVVTA